MAQLYQTTTEITELMMHYRKLHTTAVHPPTKIPILVYPFVSLVTRREIMQQRRRSRIGALSIVVFGLTLGFLGPQVTNARPLTDCDHFTGTYLTTLTDADGNFASRSILTLSVDGTLLSSNSSQGGLKGVFNPFTTAQGTWQCTGSQAFAATVLDFTLEGSAGPDLGIGRLDYKAMVDRETQAVEGTVELRFFPLKGNPLSDKTTLSGTFSFVGQRIP